MTHNCRVCNVVLNEENWFASGQKNSAYICKNCKNEQARQYHKANPEKSRGHGRLWRIANLEKHREQQHRWYMANTKKANATNIRNRRKHGVRPFNENKECSSFLGVHVAERVLSYVFKHVEKMCTNNPGYDFICGQGYKIDVKSSCRRKREKRSDSWRFSTKKNQIAEYFLCLAFDDRESLNPEYMWLIPGKMVNHLTAASISQSNIHKWDDYKLDINKVVSCCNVLRDQEN